MFGGTISMRLRLTAGMLTIGLVFIGAQASVFASTAGWDQDSERLSYVSDGFSSYIRLSSYATAGGSRYLLEDDEVTGQIGLHQPPEMPCSNALRGSIDCSRVSSYSLRLTEGNDSVIADLSPAYTRRIAVTALGGNDSIIGGSGVDSIDGGEGNDEIDSWSGDDWITGGPGNDLERGWGGRDMFPMGSAPDGNDRVDGGDEVDVVDYSQRTRTIKVTVGADDLLDGDRGAGESDSVGASIEEVRGGSESDDLTAGPSGTRLVGNGGNDRLVGSSGPDVIEGGNDNDTIRALGGGFDQVSCGYGYDDVRLDTTDLIVDPGSCEQIEHADPAPVSTVPASIIVATPRTDPRLENEIMGQFVPERTIEHTTTTNQVVKETLLGAPTAIVGAAQPKVKIVSATRKGKRVLVKLSYSGPVKKLLLSYVRGKKAGPLKSVTVVANPKKPVSFSLAVTKADIKLLSRKGRTIKLKVRVLVEGTQVVALKSVTAKKQRRG